ncbi:hypothetical protein MRX96_049128 [Rhipicephalus microplus]
MLQETTSSLNNHGIKWWNANQVMQLLMGLSKWQDAEAFKNFSGSTDLPVARASEARNTARLSTDMRPENRDRNKVLTQKGHGPFTVSALERKHAGTSVSLYAASHGSPFRRDAPDTQLARPLFLVEPPNRVVFSNATGAQIPCSVSGSPKPLVTWHTHQGHAVDSQSGVVSKGSASSGKGGAGDVPVASATPNGLRRVLQDGTLVFRAFGKSEYAADVHHATYRCSVTNSVGTIVSRDVKVRAGKP